MNISGQFIIGSLALIIVVAGIFSAIVIHTRKQRTAKSSPAKKLVSSLQDEKEKSEIILSAIEDGVILIDNHQIIQSFNTAAGVITGWPAGEANGLNCFSVIKLADDKGNALQDKQTPLSQIFKTGQSIRDNNAVLVSRSNKLIPINISVSALVDDNKQVTAAVAIFRDVTQERQSEKQRAEFISTASHEMRTPVAAIEGYLALALNDKVSTIDSRARGYIEKAHSSTQQLGKLFQDLLTSAKAEDGRLSSHPVIIELGAFLEQLVTDFKFTAEKKNLLLEYVAGSGQTIDARRQRVTGGERVIRPLYYVRADPDRLREVVTNLFDNAVKYTNQGRITIGLTGDKQVAQFYVRDTGAGIPAEDIPHLFQKFYRVDNSATRTIGGTGLGLFISRRIVELYEGRIWVESSLDKGSSFYINLPRLSTEEAARLQAAEARNTDLKPITSLIAS
ncbi:MAG TPA: ATP-binding protein [Candidatus Dormibacteraeota bacterium]|nr:ATP-binding protein [Candidatus Dormibacteraeota bacterium]